ncbi:hypothetical protein C0J52_21534 [Blattella germanica]|nr:hypothetical protein C0J52_21534 [Blattella germanica]
MSDPFYQNDMNKLQYVVKEEKSLLVINICSHERPYASDTLQQFTQFLVVYKARHASQTSKTELVPSPVGK